MTQEKMTQEEKETELALCWSFGTIITTISAAFLFGWLAGAMVAGICILILYLGLVIYWGLKK